MGLINLPLLLAYTRVHCNTREVALAEKFVKLVSPECALHEDDDLVKLQVVKKFVELPILLRLIEPDVVLQKTVKGQFRIIVYVDLEWVLHELLADRSDILRKRGAEHHHLLLRRCRAENRLHITTHI